MPNRPHIPAEIERSILVESGHRCAVCGAECPLERAHIVPWRKKRRHKVDDLILLCASCHERADLEKWGEKTLRQYKERPWVLRQRAKLHERTTSATTVKVTVNIELDEAQENNQQFLRRAIAACLGSSPGAAQITSVEQGTVKATVDRVGELADAPPRAVSPTAKGESRRRLLAKASKKWNRRVFLNIPFDEAYREKLFPAIVTACWGFGLKPFCVGEKRSQQPRLNQLMGAIRSASMVINDLTRPGRMNMPLEAGMALAYQIPCAFLVDNSIPRKRTFSDLEGIDFLDHNNSPETLIEVLATWIEQQLRKKRSPHRVCSVPIRFLRTMCFNLNCVFLQDHLRTSRGERLTLEQIRRMLASLWKQWSLADILEFSGEAGKWIDSKVAARRLELMKAYAMGMT